MTKQQSLTMGKTQRMVGLAIFTAIIIVLQLVSTFIKFGPFSITLAMIPIVVGAAVYGAGAGAYLAAYSALWFSSAALREQIPAARSSGTQTHFCASWSAWPRA